MMGKTILEKTKIFLEILNKILGYINEMDVLKDSLYVLREGFGIFKNSTRIILRAVLYRSLENHNSELSIFQFRYFLKIIPKSSREESIADLQSMIMDLKEQDYSRIKIRIAIMLHLISTLYYSLSNKLKGYFYPKTKQSREK